MKDTDYSNIELEEAMQWVHEKCRMGDIRKRMKSRAVAWVIYRSLIALTLHTHELYQRIEELENGDK